MDKSPFPGMDPYLEKSDYWLDFHHRLANQISAQLMAHLPARYVALLERYYAIDYSGLGIVGAPPPKGLYPDVQVSRVKEAATIYQTIMAPTIELVSPIPEKVALLRVEIRDVEEHRLVTVIEILSPANKQGPGFDEYVKKRTTLLQTSTHLLELDLLRGGERIPLIGGELPPAPYYVFLSRFTHRPYTEVWPLPLREPLPVVPVPLLPPDADVPLDLQAAVDACFAIVRYHERLLDYSQPPPPPPFGPEDLAWIRSILQVEAE